jgi:hypothetical protein
MLAGMTTSAQLLAAVNTAIMQALTAQSYTVHGRSKQMAALRDLMKARTELMDEADAEASGSMVSLLSLEQPTA